VIYEVTHRTKYEYEAPVSASYGQAHLLPRERPGQWCRQAEVMFDPPPGDRSEHVDYFGNRTLNFSILQPHTSLTVTALSTVEVQEPPPMSLLANQPWELVQGAIASAASPLSIAAGEFVLDSPRVAASAELSAFASPSFATGRPIGEAVADLIHRIHGEFEYVPGATTVTSTIDELMESRQGVCQDFAHLAIGCLRSVGLAARYVSGYLETVPPPGKARVAGADQSHAWASLFVPGDGWIDVDPTNDRFVGDRYVTTAWGRDYGDVPPLEGVIFTDGNEHELTVTVDVIRLAD
jgi:transglutaminase-like putative cysteine protease